MGSGWKALLKNAFCAVTVKTTVVNTSTLHWKHCCILHEKYGTKWATKSLYCTHEIQAWQLRADLHFAMTIHKISNLLISNMEQLLTANSGLLDNRCVFTTVISSKLSILDVDALIICLLLRLTASGGTLEAGRLRINAVGWYYFFSFSCVFFSYLNDLFIFFLICFLPFPGEPVYVSNQLKKYNPYCNLGVSKWLCCDFCHFLALQYITYIQYLSDLYVGTYYINWIWNLLIWCSQLGNKTSALVT